MLSSSSPVYATPLISWVDEPVLLGVVRLHVVLLRLCWRTAPSRRRRCRSRRSDKSGRSARTTYRGYGTRTLCAPCEPLSCVPRYASADSSRRGGLGPKGSSPKARELELADAGRSESDDENQMGTSVPSGSGTGVKLTMASKQPALRVVTPKTWTSAA